MNKLISIIIPTKNNGDIIEKCLSSIEGLDYPREEMEVIIVDGHSTDDTVEIAKKYGCKIVYEDVGTIGVHTRCNGLPLIKIRGFAEKEKLYQQPFLERKLDQRNSIFENFFRICIATPYFKTSPAIFLQ